MKIVDLLKRESVELNGKVIRAEAITAKACLCYYAQLKDVKRGGGFL